MAGAVGEDTTARPVGGEVTHYARKQDASARGVIDAFKAVGCSVVVITSAQAGCPDLALGVAGRTHLVEIKPDVGITARRNLRPAQATFSESWRGGPVHVVRSADEALRLVELLRMATTWRAP